MSLSVLAPTFAGAFRLNRYSSVLYSVFNVPRCLYVNPFRVITEKYGSHLLSRIVSNTVPSAASVLTVVFGMRTGVSPERIATGKDLVVIVAS